MRRLRPAKRPIKRWPPLPKPLNLRVILFQSLPISSTLSPYAERVKAWEHIGLSVEVLGVAEMEKLGMGSLLGVGLGSARESKLVVMQWLGADKSEQPIAFVGKGVTFDTGGISIKPADGMEDMKWDMGGSAAVCGYDDCFGRAKSPCKCDWHLRSC